MRAFAAAGCHGMTAIAALTAQNTLGVDAVHAVPASFLLAQLDSVQRDIGIDAAKTGMLFTAELVDTVADFFVQHPLPLVVDPVCIASSGAILLEASAIEVMVTRLVP
ncbi:MAG: bifunctional hydroxymethylpyrimidine kinase/phosphomethylpyrimidine kinase, partial [Candidatus Dormibacteria bacterium]